MRGDLDPAASLLLFVPADRPDRFGRAIELGADVVIVDLEDSVTGERKGCARRALLEARRFFENARCPLVVRVNPANSHHFAADLEIVGSLPFQAIMLSKAEAANDASRLAQISRRPVIALIETARGLACARAISLAGARLAFGSIDFAADLGCTHTREALLLARSELVLASCLAEMPPPIDGITTSIKDAVLVEDETRHAISLGMGGKLLIHPAQIEPARSGLRPSPEQVKWAERVLEAGTEGATAVDGAMVDVPVKLRAMQVLQRSARAARD